MFTDAVPRKSSPLTKLYGMVFISGSELFKLDNRAINVLLHTQVVVTTSDISAKELYTKIYELVKKDDEKDEKERTLTGLMESVILFIRQSDFDRLQKPL